MTEESENGQPCVVHFGERVSTNVTLPMYCARDIWNIRLARLGMMQSMVTITSWPYLIVLAFGDFV